jgi:predicted transglutaminase-like cysteine proteinase
MRFGQGALAAAVVTVALAAQGLAAGDPAHAFLPQGAAAPAPRGAEGLCARYDWACARQDAGRVPSRADLELAQKVNRAVNARTRQVTDQAQYGRGDVWALPTATGGDCEDLALAKKRMLVASGFPSARLLVATALDRARQPHAVLVVRTGSGDLVLDSRTDRVMPWVETGYVFLRVQDPRAPGRWRSVHAGG